MTEFGHVLTIAAGERLDQLIKRRIADPIGITNWSWKTVPTSREPVLDCAGGITTTSLELARFGHLYLNRGNWNGTQLISASWIDQATTVQVPASIPYYANGLNDNVCIVVPEWNMVITDQHQERPRNSQYSAEHRRDLERLLQPDEPGAVRRGTLRMPGSQIVVLPGDGTGRDVMTSALQVLRAAGGVSVTSISDWLRTRVALKRWMSPDGRHWPNMKDIDQYSHRGVTAR